MNMYEKAKVEHVIGGLIWLATIMLHIVFPEKIIFINIFALIVIEHSAFKMQDHRKRKINKYRVITHVTVAIILSLFVYLSMVLGGYYVFLTMLVALGFGISLCLMRETN